MFFIFRMICLEKEKRKLSKWLSLWLEHFYMYPCRLSIERKCCHVKLIHVFTFKKSDALIKCFQLYSALIEKHLLMNWKEFASLHFPCFAWFLFSHLLGHFSLQDCFKNSFCFECTSWLTMKIRLYLYKLYADSGQKSISHDFLFVKFIVTCIFCTILLYLVVENWNIRSEFYCYWMYPHIN